MTTARIRIGPEPSYLERLAIIYADPLRLTIVTELFRREMSPSRFQAAFGGGSLSRVDHHFKRLAESGWLRQVRVESGSGRRGGVEHFYRAPKLPVLDTDAWDRLPVTVREEFSWRMFEQFAERVKDAFEGGTLDERQDRHLTWTPLVLDQAGREHVLAVAEALFYSLLEEERDAELRIERSGETPINATVGIVVFDSPDRPRNRSGLSVPTARGEDAGSDPFTTRLARVLASPLNLRIVDELNRRELSPSQFAEEFDLPLSQVSRRFKMLAQNRWLEIAAEKTGGRRRGATERFYRARRPVLADTRSWSEVADGVRSTFSWRVFEQLAEQVREALEAGTFDARPDRHLTWTPVRLDRRGWQQLITEVDDCFHNQLAEQKAATARLEGTAAEPVILTACLAAFESPELGMETVGPRF